MAQSYYPLSKSPILTQEQWSKMAKNWLKTGVLKGYLNELQVYADSTGMNVKVKSGAAYIEGHYFESDAEEVFAIGSAASGQRIDRVIVRLDWVANNASLAIIQGSPAPTPTAPALTQNSSRWEISLAQIFVDTNAVTISVDKVTDERNFGNLFLSSSNDNERIEELELTFTTSGSASSVTASANFKNAFSFVPTIFPANITQTVSYADRIIYPFIFNITTTGFSVTLKTGYTGVEIPNFAAGTIKMKFIAKGK